jgi:Ca2+/Na+ antiporter
MAGVYALCAAYAAYCLVSNPAGPITTPDSIRYLDMWPNYPMGYQLFLKLTGERGAIIAQPILYAAALALLGREIVRATGSTWLALAILAGSMVLPQLREFHASILSESVFLSLLVIFLALAVRYMHHPTWKLMAAIAITAGLSAMVRRTGFALAPVILVMLLMQRRPFIDFAAALASFALVLSLDQAATRVIHGDEASSLMGRHLFAKAALIDVRPSAEATEDKPPATPAGAIEDQLENTYAPIRRMLASAPTSVRAVLTIYYETCLQGGCADQARAATGEATEAGQTAVMGTAGLARIRRAPINFLKLTWMHYGSLWTVNRLRHPDIAADLNAFLATHRPLPYEELAMALGPNRTLEFTGSESVRYVQYAIFAIAIVTAMLALAGLVTAITARRLPAALGTAAVAAVTLHAGLVLTALLAAGFSRFLLGLWPAVVMACAFGVFHCAVMFGRPLRRTNF